MLLPLCNRCPNSFGKQVHLVRESHLHQTRVYFLLNAGTQLSALQPVVIVRAVRVAPVEVLKD